MRTVFWPVKGGKMVDGNVSSSPCCRVSRSARSSADSCLTNGSARVLVVGFHDLSDLCLLKPYTGRSTWLLDAGSGRETGRWACMLSVTLSYVCLLRDSVTRLTFQREVEPIDRSHPLLLFPSKPTMSRTPPRASSRSRPASPDDPFGGGGGAANLADRFANVSLASDAGAGSSKPGSYNVSDKSVSSHSPPATGDTFR